VENVPAYRDFLKKRKVDYKSIRNIADFEEKVPEMTKDNYIKKYEMENICRDGKLPEVGNIDESAGSSGEPTNWMRNIEEERFLSKIVQFDFDYTYGGDKKEYIVLSAWASGPWATGVKFCELMQNYSLVKNTDADIENIVKTLKKFGYNYNYLIAGYPPFIKNLVDCGKIKWGKYKNIDILTGGEGFVPEWRAYIKSKLGKKTKIISAYGSSDLDIGIAVETQFSIFIRDLLAKNKELRRELCGHEDKIPMVFQFDPLQHYIKNVTVTRKDGAKINEFQVTMLNPKTESPKIKYNIHDEGGVLGFEEMSRRLRVHEPDYLKKFRKNGGIIRNMLHFPFLMVIGRSDGTISLDGANVYPHNIEVGLHCNKKLAGITSNFKISNRIDKKKDACFIVCIELKKGVKPSKSLRTIYHDTIFKKLLEINSDYRRSYKNNNSLKPTIKLFEYGKGHFKDKNTIKNRYII